MRGIIFRALAVAVIPAILGIITSSIYKHNSDELMKNLKKEHIVIRLPKAYRWIGVTDTIFSCFLVFMMHLTKQDALWADLLGFVFLLMGIFIVTITFTWKIDIFCSRDYFIYRSMAGRTHRLEYKDIIQYVDKGDVYVLETKNKKFYVDVKATNVGFLSRS
jgi:magnesium-transporting ATPase (P-type)